MTAVTEQRPPGVPDTARLVTLAELKDRIAKESGSLRLGPRGSYLRFEMRRPSWLFGLRGTARAVLGGGVNADHGQRSFALEFASGTRTPSTWKIMAFTGPDDWAAQPVWIWTLDDEAAWRKAGRP